jgi:hypothetical protein
MKLPLATTWVWEEFPSPDFTAVDPAGLPAIGSGQIFFDIRELRGLVRAQ